MNNNTPYRIKRALHLSGKPLNRRELLLYTMDRPWHIMDAVKAMVEGGELQLVNTDLPIDHYDQEYSL